MALFTFRIGFTRPKCSIVLSRSPNAAPTFPLRSVIAGNKMIRPGSAENLFSIPVSIKPVTLSPITERSNTKSDCVSILLREFCGKEIRLLEECLCLFVFVFNTF